MSLVTLVAPPNIPPGGTFSDSAGNATTIDATGRCQVDTSVVRMDDFAGAGFVPAPDTASAVRPTVTYPGQPYFDTTLAAGVGKPIWRNAANTGWIDATGASV